MAELLPSKEQVTESVCADELKLICEHGQPHGIRDRGGYLLFFPTVPKFAGQEDRYRSELAQRFRLADFLLKSLQSVHETTTEFDVVGAAKFAEEIIQRVCELPDRNSPDDEPEALVCSPSELEGCIVGVMEIRWERKTGRSVLDQSPPKTSTEGQS